MKLEFYTLSAIFVCAVEYVYGKNVSPCEDGLYYDEWSNDCRTCAVCPINTIILTPCGFFDDTKCGPFTDFFHFHQESGKSSINRAFVQITKDSSSLSSAPGSEVTISPRANGSGTFFEISDEWYLISMVLLGILCFISLIIALYIIFACFVCKKASDKVVVYEPEYITVSQQASPGSYKYRDTLVTASPDILMGCQTSLTPVYEDDGPITMGSPNIYINNHYIEPKDALLGQMK
ncbi:uncharacterized protein LOC110448432 [Mizuhopecten yessoensis]|uniref:TNFR-Cys domain-containing protein n=1 Tax=Mizuhopecten yessoensis TaxID=6573 RepID=A0A210QT81_MIZYE|nr:uncharacterized protein LOC110448432 [Mizuhopecten yessoensis]OWF51941.1 hypothetical protein KP79_PYT18483 [Mizuhopecten yessoensis]